MKEIWEKYEKELKKIGYQERALTITLQKRGRPLLSGKDIDSIVQDYLKVSLKIINILTVTLMANWMLIFHVGTRVVPRINK